MKKNRACIIAEAGVNHNGNIDKAVKMIQTASKIGADIIKFQAFNVDETILKNTQKAKYQLLNTKKNEDQYEALFISSSSLSRAHTYFTCNTIVIY